MMFFSIQKKYFDSPENFGGQEKTQGGMWMELIDTCL